MTVPLVQLAVKRAAKWLAGRGQRVSKHIGLHRSAATRQPTRPWLADKAAHTITRHGDQPRKLLQKTLAKYDRATVQASRRAGEAPRVLVERQFDRAVGRQGERVYKVVIDSATGEIITGYAVGEFTIPASGVFITVFDDVMTDAIREIESTIATRAAAKRGSARPADHLTGFIDFVASLALDPAAAGENEDIMLEVASIHRRRLAELIALTAEQEKRSLGPTEIDAIRAAYYEAVNGAADASMEE